MSKTRLAFFGILALLLLVAPLATQAISAKANESVYIAKDQTVDSSLYTAGTSITVDGTVKGDVVCAGQSILINGTVEGDVICAGQSIVVNGKVGGSLRAAGNSVILNGSVGRTAMMAGASVTVSLEATVGWDIMMAGANGQISGKVARDIFGAMAGLQITGEVGRNVTLFMDNNNANKDDKILTIASSAKVGGGVTYTGINEANIEDGAVIKGEVKHNLKEIKDRSGDRNKGPLVGWLWFKVISIFAALVVGLILISWLPRPIKDITDGMFNKIGPSLGWGLIVLIITPIVGIILLITVIGIPLSLLLLGFWILLLYPAKILGAIAIGRKLVALKFMPTKGHHSLVWAMVVGVVICWLIFTIPIIGWLLCFLIFLWGLGGIWRYAKAKSSH